MDALALRLAVAGFDIAQPLSTTWYNEHLVGKGLPLKPLPSYGREGGALCVLIGNSRELWNAFLRWLRTQSDPMGIEEPLDLYTRGTIADAVAEAAEGVAYDIFWPSESGDRLVSMQRVALTSGLCCHDGETQLCIHPTFGAWCAFRAAVVFDRDGPAGGAPPPCPDLLSDAERAAAREAMANALKASNEERICEQCALVTYRYLPLHTVTSNEERICEQCVTYRYLPLPTVTYRYLPLPATRSGSASSAREPRPRGAPAAPPWRPRGVPARALRDAYA